MKTTELFAELVVIGVGTFAAALLLVVILIPQSWAVLSSATTIAVVPSLALIYLFGILTDRAAVFLVEFRSWRPRSKAKKKADELRAERIKCMADPQFAEDAVYAKSRIRVVRGWALNSLILVPLSAVFLVERGNVVHSHVAAWTVGTLFAGLALACYLAMLQFDCDERRAIEATKEKLVARGQEALERKAG